MKLTSGHLELRFSVYDVNLHYHLHYITLHLIRLYNNISINSDILKSRTNLNELFMPKYKKKCEYDRKAHKNSKAA